MSEKFRGVFANIPTPFDDSGDALDVSRLNVLIDFLMNRGIHGVACLLSSGEYPYLNLDERKAFLRHVVDRVAGRAPVLVGVTSLTTRDAIELATDAERAGASAAMVMPLQYWPIRKDELVAHFTQISQATSLPLGIYDNPHLGAANFTVDIYKELVEVANVQLSKDSSTILTRVAEVNSACGDAFSILHGNHLEMLPAYLLGAAGVCNAIASVIPEVCIELYELGAVNRQWDKALARFREVFPIFKFFQENSLARCVKEASEMMGRPLGPQRRPLTGLAEPQRVALRAMLKDYGYVD